MSSEKTKYEEFREALLALRDVYSLKDFEASTRYLEDMSPTTREDTLGTLVASRHVWRPLLEGAMWESYARLAQFNEDSRLDDVNRGAVNAIVALLEGFERLCGEYESLQEQKRNPLDPNNPLPEA
jgi:hypothetical protein